MSQPVSLRQALGGLASINQFFVYELTPDASRPGKTLKRPYREGDAHGVEDARYWLDMATAERYIEYLRSAPHAPGTNYTLGFAFTRGCGYFFVDVDSCFDGNGGITEIGTFVFSRFPGALYEVSSSGLGYHLIARGTAPEHSSRDTARGIEFYTEGRGVAFGLSGEAYGSADTDHTHELQTFWCPQLFPPKADDQSWHDGPRSDWRGPSDDTDLLRRAMQSKSTSSTFGTGAAFADLWENNIPVLAVAYPDPTSPDGINRSSADMALAQHLAFWTGCDGPRIERLMLASGLVRPKWTEHATYLRGHTIANAIGMQTNICQDKPVVVPPAPVSDGVATAEGQTVSTAVWLTPDDQKAYFSGCVYIAEENKIFSPRYGGVMLASDRFNAVYGGRTFVLDAENESKTKKPFEAFTLNQVIAFPKVRGTVFRPNLEAGGVVTTNGVPYLNSYWPVTIDRTPGDVSLFEVHMRKLFPIDRDRAIMMAYMAALVQHQGVKFQWCPVLQGVQGNGKSTIGDILAYCVGERYSGVVNPDDLNSNFTGWLNEKILIVANDVYISGDKRELIEKLKPIISDERQRTEAKGGAQETRNVCANFIMNMNNRDGLHLDPNERRYALFYSPHQRTEDLTDDGMTDAYFVRLHGWLKSGGFAAVCNYLWEYQIPDALNPAGSCRRAPETSTRYMALEESLGEAERAVLQAIEEGREGFAGGWVCWQRMEALLMEVRRNTMKAMQKKRMLESFGYIPHPGLLYENGTTHNPVVTEGGKRIRLWVKKGHLTIGPDVGGADIVKNYVTAQQGVTLVQTAAIYKINKG